MQLFLHALECGAKFRELGLNSRQGLPNLAGALLDGHGAESHLETIENRDQRSRSGNDHAIIPLNAFRQLASAKDFGVKSLSGEEHDRKIRCLGRIQVFVANGSRIRLDGRFELACGRLRLDCGSSIECIDQTLVVFFGKFGINR